jgi:hypothetical protein
MGTIIEKRVVLRGMLDEIEIDPMTGRGAMVFRDAHDLPMNETSPEQGAPGSKTSFGQMAGARHDRKKKRFSPQMCQVFRVCALAA